MISCHLLFLILPETQPDTLFILSRGEPGDWMNMNWGLLNEELLKFISHISL